MVNQYSHFNEFLDSLSAPTKSAVIQDVNSRFVGALKGVLLQKQQKNFSLLKLQSVMTQVSEKKAKDVQLSSLGWGSW